MAKTTARWTRWRTAVGAGVALFVAGVVPSPIGRHPEFAVFGPDKVLHFLGHAAFAITVGRALAQSRLSPMERGTLAVSASFLHGLVTGACQRHVPGREPERADLVAGLLGSIMGVLVTALRGDANGSKKGR